LFIVGSTFKSNVHPNTIWIQNGFTVAGGNGRGNKLNQLSSPTGVYIDDEQTVYVVDVDNHRILGVKYDGTDVQIVAGGNGQGNKTNQLKIPSDVIVDKERNNLIICDEGNRRIMRWSRQNNTNGQTIMSNIDCCRLTMDNNGNLYVSDWRHAEVRRWKMNDTCGTLVAGGNGIGNRLDQLDCPIYIFVDEDHSVYVSDRQNHRVVKWMEGAKEGIVVAGGQGKGNDMTQLSCPYGVFVDHYGTVYVTDCNNHRIMRWVKGATCGNIVVGGNGRGHRPNQLSYPFGLSFDQEGNLYVVDFSNNRVQRYAVNHE
jgi:sugar lactone lactonase YvrE